MCSLSRTGQEFQFCFRRCRRYFQTPDGRIGCSGSFQVISNTQHSSSARLVINRLISWNLILNDNFYTLGVICKECHDLVNQVDCFEQNCINAKEQIKVRVKSQAKVNYKRKRSGTNVPVAQVKVEEEEKRKVGKGNGLHESLFPKRINYFN